MKWRRISRVLVQFSLLVMIISSAKAQSNLIFYHSEGMLNNSTFNPAFSIAPKGITFSMLPLAGTSLIFNNMDAMGMISQVIFEEQINDSLKDIFTSLVRQNLIYQHLETSLLDIGYHTRFGSFSFLIRERVNVMVDFQDDVSQFLVDEQFPSVRINQTQTFPAEALHFREYSFGYAHELIKDKLKMGFRAKLYYGKSSMYSDVSASLLEGSSGYYVHSYGPMKLSLPADIVIENGQVEEFRAYRGYTAANYLFNTGNVGTGFDFGFSYMPRPDIEVSASVTDLGKIKWKNGLNTLSFEGEYQLSASSLIKTITEDGVEILTKENDEVSLTDSITSIFDILPIEETGYTKAIPTNYYAGLKYRYSERLQFGIVDNYTVGDKLKYNNLLLSVNYALTKQFFLNTGYSKLAKSYFNLPVGFSYKWDGGSAYLGTDNLISLILPSVSNVSGISFGMNIYLYRLKPRYRKVDYLPFFKQKKQRKTNEDGLMLY